MEKSLAKFFKSFHYAFQGIAFATHGRNFKIQLSIGIIAIISGIFFNISPTEWLFVILLTGLVLGAEAFNTALEELSDVVKEHNRLDYLATKHARDLAAGGVLIFSLAAAIIGLIIFLPKFF